MPKYTIDDFTGGITDNVEDAPLNYLQTSNNFTMTDHKKLKSRWGINELTDFPTNPIYKTLNGGAVKYLTKFFTSNNAVAYRFAYCSTGSAVEVIQYDNVAAGGITHNIAGRGNLTAPGYKSTVSASVALVPDPAYPPTSYIPLNGFIQTERGIYWAGNTGLYRFDQVTQKILNASLPYSGVGTLTPVGINGSGGGGTYLYYAHYFHQYTYNGLTFIDFGPVAQDFVTHGQDIGTGTRATDVTGQVAAKTWGNSMPSVALGSIVGIAMYRTKKNGTTAYLVSDRLDNITSWSDNKTDTQIPIQSSYLLPSVVYIDGGVLDDESDMTSSNNGTQRIMLANNCMWAIARRKANTLRQSKPLQYNSWPGSFGIDFNEDIVDFDRVDIYPVVFTISSVTRIENTVDARGIGIPRRRLISENLNVLKNSLVRHDTSLFGIATQGFFKTDAFKIDMLKTDLIAFMSQYTAVIQGKYHAEANKVFWLVQRTGGNDILEMDLSHQSTPIITFYRHDSSLAYTITSIESDRDFLWAGCSNSTLIKFNPYLSSDKVPVINDVPSAWLKRPIVPTVTTVPISMGERFATKWFTKIYLFCKNFGLLWPNLTLKVTSLAEVNAADNKDLKIIRERGNTTTIFSVKRWMRRGKIRSRYRQFTLAAAQVIITDSTTLGTVTTNPGVPNAVLAAGVFPAEVVPGMLMYFDSDGYTVGYPIITVSGDTVIFGTVPPALAGALWTINGYPMDEIVQFDGIELEYAPTGETIEGYKTSDDGGNA